METKFQMKKIYDYVKSVKSLQQRQKSFVCIRSYFIENDYNDIIVSLPKDQNSYFYI